MTPKAPNWLQFSTATIITAATTTTTETAPPLSPPPPPSLPLSAPPYHHHWGIEWVVCHELWPNLSFLLISFSTSFCFDGNDRASFAQILGIFFGGEVTKAMKMYKESKGQIRGNCFLPCYIVRSGGPQVGGRTVKMPSAASGTGYLRSVEFGSRRLRFSKIWILTLY